MNHSSSLRAATSGWNWRAKVSSRERLVFKNLRDRQLSRAPWLIEGIAVPMEHQRSFEMANYRLPPRFSQRNRRPSYLLLRSGKDARTEHSSDRSSSETNSHYRKVDSRSRLENVQLVS
jgi:hypothetical protein